MSPTFTKIVLFSMHSMKKEELKIKDTEKMYFVQGFKRGLTGMCKGEIRRILCRQNTGMVRSGAAYIPGNTTLVYEVEMIALDNAKGRERERKIKEEQRREIKSRGVSRRAIFSILSLALMGQFDRKKGAAFMTTI